MRVVESAREIIGELEANRFYAECPCCQENILLRDANLFYLDEFTGDAEKLYQRQLEELEARRKRLREKRRKISETSEVRTEAVNIGRILERVAPSLKEFCFDRNDCRPLLDPIDYLVFEGLHKKGAIGKILFVEIKTGESPLTSVQREIRSLVERKRVSWDTYEMEGSK